MGKRLLLTVGLLLTLAACGGDDDRGRVTASSDRETDSTTTTLAEEEEAPSTTHADDSTTTTTTTAADDTATTTTARPKPGATTTTAGSAGTTTTTASTTTTTAAAGTAYPKDAGTPDSRVALTLTLDRTELTAGSTIKGVLTVENTSNDEIAVDRGGCDFVWGLFRDGSFLGGHESQACPAILKHDRLKPREVRRYEMTFDAYDNREPRKPLPAGTYDAFGGWDVAGGHWYAPAVKVTIR